jgi:hypothetical protein
MPAPERPASTLHTYGHGISADLLHRVGGYPGLTEEARKDLPADHLCRQEDPNAGLPLTFTSDKVGFITVHAENP